MAVPSRHDVVGDRRLGLALSNKQDADVARDPAVALHDDVEVSDRHEELVVADAVSHPDKGGFAQPNVVACE